MKESEKIKEAVFGEEEDSKKTKSKEKKRT